MAINPKLVLKENEPIGNIKRMPLKKILRHPRIKGMIDDGEKWCHTHNNADRIDLSNTWEFRRESVITGMRFLMGKNNP